MQGVQGEKRGKQATSVDGAGQTVEEEEKHDGVDGVQAQVDQVVAAGPGAEELPVERVSFDDVARFLHRLKIEFTEGCNAGLPTEAQWEYACRAGTEAAFAFGDTINPQQVNYDGNEPYGNAAKGLYRERTVPVKALPANRWGLFQMHGNVWEWCDDYGRDYGRNDAETAVADGFVLDPAGQRGSGPEARRAVRGGSWVRIAGLARSACRASFPRGGRSRSLGFRFALRSTSQGPAEPAGPEGLQVLGLGPEGR